MQKLTDEPVRPEPAPRRLGLVLLPVLFFAAVAAMFAYALRTADPSKLPSTLLGKAAPALDLSGLDGLLRDGRPVPGFTAPDLARGDVVIVNFFASWCAPCVQEHPLLIDLKRTSGVRLVGINHKDPSPGGLRFLTRYGNPFDAVGVDGNGRAAIEWGVYGMPETFVIDGAGRIVYKHVGQLTPDVVSARIMPAIAQAGTKK